MTRRLRKIRMKRLLVKAAVSGDWLPNSSLAMVKVDSAKADVDGLYEMLGVDPCASDEEVRATAKRRLLESHPDVGGDTDEFIRVHKAYETLANPARRAAYDARKRSSLSIRSVATSAGESAASATGGPAFYKDVDTVLTEEDVKRVREWQDMLLETAYEFGIALEIKAGICKYPAGYSVDEDIALIGIGTVPERWGARLFILREMSLR